MPKKGQNHRQRELPSGPELLSLKLEEDLVTYFEPQVNTSRKENDVITSIRTMGAS